ncbi:hypothetical protein [Oharaeibacter diazotrophicus]|uniref:Repeat protein (TIGR01451 family) n=1 Tax=Oharaeibacter diazotrophicus TaxID=1920512 RepID=A0A4R6R4T3_9HYPH|nr:hypothetical protein [Oharaeibacter diazotrophicus]TDP80911.1 hypothetical protein EDD54_4544 [Oharaeibacter diazotrophicus]BBE73806.1 hypothetical protein OHA_1_03422 [Pleomorphomonas sp. SM30]GLS74710.1 hypothetical protein GCM10007904_00450 [Oharaeibacter diazotrophicus]
MPVRSIRLRSLLVFALLAAAAPAAAAPGNDEPGNAHTISSGQRSLFGSLTGATADPGVTLMGSAARPSVWYRIDAPPSGWYYVDSAGTDSGRDGARDIALSVFERKADGSLKPIREGGRVKIDGRFETDLSGVRFFVPPQAGPVLIAASVPAAAKAGAFRLNLHRMPSDGSSPIVLTPPTPFQTYFANVLGAVPVTDRSTTFAIYTPMPANPVKARLALSHDFGASVVPALAADTVVGDNEGATVRLKTVGLGPDQGAIGTFDHIVGVEARTLVSGVTFAKRAMLRKVLRPSTEVSSGSLHVTASAGLRLGPLGETVSFDLVIRNRLGLPAKGCILVNGIRTLVAAGPLDVGQAVNWQVVDPQTGLPSPQTARTFDVAANTTRLLRVSAEVRVRDAVVLDPSVVCASPRATTSIPFGALHHRLVAENAPLVVGLAEDRAEPALTFVPSGAGDDAPRLYKVSAAVGRRFAVDIRGPGALGGGATFLKVRVNQNAPWQTPAKSPLQGQVCLDTVGPGEACVTAPKDEVALVLGPGETRRVLVTLPAGLVPSGQTARLYVQVTDGAMPVALGGFAVAGQ